MYKKKGNSVFFSLFFFFKERQAFASRLWEYQLAARFARGMFDLVSRLTFSHRRRRLMLSYSRIVVVVVRCMLYTITVTIR